jgi:phosphoglycerol transferase
MMKSQSLKLIVQFLVFFIAFFVIFSTKWVTKNFGEVTVDQIIYHLTFGTDNLLDSDKKLVEDFYSYCLYKSLFCTFLVFLIHNYHQQIRGLFRAIAVYVEQKHYYQKLSSCLLAIPLSVAFLMFAILFASFKYSAFSYIKDQIASSGEDFYATHYVAPDSVKLKENNPKNLILIYVESLESTYQDANLFDTNLIESVQTAQLGGISFNKQRQLPGTGWTMAGITATQCGVSLKPKIGGGDKLKNRILEDMDTFLPNIKCLGDILKEHHYKNVFIGGASLKFAGKGQFFHTHGYDETYGREEFMEMNHHKIPVNNWGIYDDDLLDFAKHKIDELASQSRPYNLTLLTLDTHQPEGHLSQTCSKRGVKEFKGIVRCTTEMIADLTNYVNEKGYSKNTTIVIMGDHLVMMNPQFRNIIKSPHRYIFNNYISPDASLKKNRDEFVHFDHLPTILDSIGLKVAGGRLGLGLSGFYEGTLPPLKTRFDDYQQNVLRASARYQDFWRPNQRINMNKTND